MTAQFEKAQLSAQLDDAKSAYSQGNYEEAAQKLSRLESEDPDNAEFKYWLGLSLSKLGQQLDATAKLQEALRSTEDPQLLQSIQSSIMQVSSSPSPSGEVSSVDRNGRSSSESTNGVSPQPAFPTREGARPLSSSAKDLGSHSDQKSSLKTTATAIAVVLGTVPVLIVGGLATLLASNSLTEKVEQEQRALAVTISRDLAEFASERLQDIQTVASAPFLTNPELQTVIPPEDQIQFIEEFEERTSDFFTLIVPVTAEGGVTYIGDGTIPLMTPKTREDITPRVFEVDNIWANAEIDFFVAARDSLAPAIIPLRLSASSGQSSFYISVPSFNTAGELTAITYAPTQAESIAAFIRDNVTSLTSQIQAETADQSKFSVFVETPAYFTPTVDDEGNTVEEEVSVFATLDIEGSNIRLNGETLELGKDIFVRTNRVFVSDDNQGLGEPIQSIFPQVEELISAGRTATIVDVHSVENRPYLVSYAPVPQVIEGLETQWGTLSYESVDIAFSERNTLLLVFTIGTVGAAVLVGFVAAALSAKGIQPLLAAIGAVRRISQGDMEARMPVKGNDELAVLGSSINQMADQIEDLLDKQAQARQEAEQIAREQRQQKETLQDQLLSLLSEVEGAASGDLTVRANITSGEMGTVADFFNAIVESLRSIVTQVKETSNQLNSSLVESEQSTRHLADQSSSQVEEITRTLGSVQEMTLSIQEVAASARQAAEVARTASTTVQAGGQAMDKTVSGILNLRETVAETAKKVKRLGESSQKISKVVSLINQIALQTNLLAINASIEAARAGEEGRGFAVVAEEVGALAAQSANATKEIEQLIEAIQQETSEVVEAMDRGTSEVVQGTQLVEEAKQNLGQLLEVSQQIDQLVQSISTATVSQAQTSESVNALMQALAQISKQSSESSRQVSQSLQTTVELANNLQESVAMFKVDSQVESQVSE